MNMGTWFVRRGLYMVDGWQYRGCYVKVTSPRLWF